MPYYKYRAKDKYGNITENELFAVDSDAVATKLAKEFLTPISIKEFTKKNVKKKANLNQLFEEIFVPKLKVDDLILFSKQMHAMLRAGVPILRSLKAILGVTKAKRMQQILKDAVEGLEKGKSLSKSIEDHVSVLPTLFVSLLEVGENSGNLDVVFLQLSEYLDRDRAAKRQVKEALRYPSFVIIAVVGAIVILSIFVIPTFEGLFKSMGAELPAVTKILLTTSYIMKSFWHYILLSFLGVYFAIKILFTRGYGRLAWDRYKLKLPILGNIFLKVILERFSRSFTLMYDSGVPLLQVLTTTSKVVDNQYVSGKIIQMKADVERGESLAVAAKKTKLFTPLVMQMILIGEETGEVQKMLIQVAEQYTEELNYELKALSSYIEPLLITVMSGIVLVLLLGIFLPMWDLITLAK